MTRDEAATLKPGDILLTLVECAGETSDDREVTHPVGTEARVLGVRTLPAPQGLAVTLAVGEAESEQVVAVFDEADICGFAFERPRDEGFTAAPRMESAGAELMALSFRLERVPDFDADVARLREIAGWASTGRLDDLTRASMSVMGAMFGAMRRRGFQFREDLPISTQFETFLAAVPEPLPGESDHVVQATLDPKERRDAFDAEIGIGDVRRWTARDGVERALARDAAVKPDGVHGVADVYAEGDEARLLTDGAVVRLRSAGGALKVVGEGDMGRAAREVPPEDVSRAAATLLRPLPFDKEAAAIVAKGLDLFLSEDDLPGRYESEAVERAVAIRDALDGVAR